MQDETSICFSQVHPFVRYIHKLPISYGEYPHFTKAYDNRLFYVSRGEGTMYIGDDTYKLVPGDLLLWKSNIGYHMDSEDGLEFLAVNFDYTQVSRNKNYPIPPEKNNLFDANDLLEYIRFTDILDLNDQIFLNSMFHLEEMLLEILREYDSKMIYYIERMSSLFLNLLVYVVREASTSRKYNVSTSRRVNEIIDYIHNHYQENITYERIGQLFNYHPNYINKLMLLYTKKTFHQYLLAYRISKAIDMIYITNKPVAEIAAKVGFDDPGHFCRLFKQKVGLSPSIYRKTHQEPVGPSYPAK